MIRKISIHGVGPVHSGRPGVKSKVVMTIGLDYLKSRPIETVELSRYDIILMIEQLARALRSVET